MGITYKTPQGVYLTRQIFFETSTPPRDFALYSLSDEDKESGGKLYPSIRRLYVEMEDESEYQFAVTYFGNYSHWKAICKCNWFIPHLEEMREELQAKVAAKSLLSLRAKRDEGDVSASKYLLEKKWDSRKDPVGRPSKQRIQEEAQKIVSSKSDYQDDLDRLLSHSGTPQ